MSRLWLCPVAPASRGRRGWLDMTGPRWTEPMPMGEAPGPGEP
jgi:hypothetical protein